MVVATMRDRVRDRFELNDHATAALVALEEIGPAPGGFDLPSPLDARRILDRLNFAPATRDEVIATLPDVRRDPEAWWVLERLYHVLIDRESTVLAPPWPGPWPGDDALSRYFHLYVFLAAVPHVLRMHSAAGVPEAVSWDTIDDLTLQVAHFHALHGRPGFDGAFWMLKHFRGEVYRLGRLQFEPTRASFEPATAAPFGLGDEVLGVHIPVLGPLHAGDCDASFAAARRFFRRHGDARYRFATCTSWLLDDQLAEYLPDGSNIVAFQRRFTLTPDSLPGDEDVLRFVFGAVPSSIDELPRRTTLERAVVAHLQGGRSWRLRHGWLDLERTPV